MYSQSREDEIIINYFKDYIGSFCSIGENDGITFSNVKRLFEMGWSGVCIEPSPKAFKRLKANYNGHKGIYLYNFAIGDHNGRVILHESGPLCNSHDIALVSTRHAHEMDRFKATVKYEPIEVKCFRWKTFLNRSRIKEFDFISLDAEGDDSMILEQIDLSKVKCVCVEWNSKDNLKTEFERMLREFKVIYTSAENLIFAR